MFLLVSFIHNLKGYNQRVVKTNGVTCMVSVLTPAQYTYLCIKYSITPRMGGSVTKGIYIDVVGKYYFISQELYQRLVDVLPSIT